MLSRGWGARKPGRKEGEEKNRCEWFVHLFAYVVGYVGQMRVCNVGEWCVLCCIVFMGVVMRGEW